MIKKLCVGAAPILVLAGYLFSPYWALSGLARAAIEHRSIDFADYIDLEEIQRDFVVRIAETRPVNISLDAQAIDTRATQQAVGALFTADNISRAFAANLQPYANDSRAEMAWNLMRAGGISWVTPTRISLGPAGEMRRTFLTWKLDRFGQLH